MGIGVHILFQISVLDLFLHIYPEVELLDHKGVPFLIFRGNPIVFFSVAALICIPTNSAQGFPFLHILANAC